MATLDTYLSLVQTQDNRKRLQAHTDLVQYLRDPTNSLECEDMDRFVDGLVGWVNSSNYKICLNGLEVLSLLVERMGDDFRHHVNNALSSVVDRLGDNKDQVREQSQDVLVKLMSASSSQYVWERMTSTFTHKLWRVREEALICLQNTLTRFGTKGLGLSKIVPVIVKMLDDQSSQVRDAAVNTLVEIYRHVGDKVRHDLAKKGISANKLSVLFSRMDEIKNTGMMMPSADAPPRTHDETDFARPIGAPKMSKRVGSAPTTRKSAIGGRTASTSSTSQAGGVDEEFFIKSFEDVPNVNIFSSRDVSDHLTKIKEMLQDANHPWEKRVDSLREIRGILIAGATDHDEFFPLLRTLEPCITTSVKDLRSQVVRESCITVAYLSQQLKNKFDHFAESLLQHLIALIPNSAKIMASSGAVCIRFIIQNTHGPRLIPIITSNLSSKSNIIRRDCSEFLDQLLHTWPTHTLERHIALLQDAIRKGISDADSEARAHSRKAFWGFANHFKEQADSLLNSLDSSKQKMLQGELSNSSSNNSLNNTGSIKKKESRSRSASMERSRDVFARHSLTSSRRPASHKTTSPLSDTTDGYAASDERSTNGALVRSNSAVDLAGSGKKMSTTSRPSYSNYNSLRESRSSSDLLSAGTESTPATRIPVPGGSRTPDMSRQRKASSKSTVQSIISPERSRPRSRIGVSQSQPSSRSGSPSSRLSYLTHTMGPTSHTRRKSGIPCRSQGASREASPSRHTYGRERKMSGGSTLRHFSSRTPHTASKGSRLTSKGSTGTVMAQRVLTHSRETEQALADALAGGRKRYESYDSDDAASETSSVCSERSYSSFGRTSEMSQLSNLISQCSNALSSHHGESREERLRALADQDMAEVLSNMASASWADRKEGLIALQNILRANRSLNRIELKKVTEIFTRMFHDPHGKVFSMFLETLVDFLTIHRGDIHDWLYILLTRLLNKMGADMLGSVLAKVERALEAVRDSFPYDLQFSTLTRFIIDQTQTPNLKVKVKVALLNYMHGLTLLMDPSDFINSSDTRLAVSRIITWTTEPKSVDVRKAAQAVLISLFNLNTPEFSMMLSVLPKTFQDGATKILHNHLRSSSRDDTTEPLSPRNITSPTTGPESRFRPMPRSTARDELETENMNPEDIYNSIKKTTTDIQNLSKLDGQYDDIKKERDTTSQDSGIQSSMPDVRAESPEGKGRPQYNPSIYQDESVNGYNRAALAEAVFDVERELFNEELPKDQSDVVAEILTELSNHNERHEERKNVMLQLIKMTREGSVGVWEEHFKTILLLLLETLGDNDGHIRALSLRVLREILRTQPTRFQGYAELTILKILEAHKDPMKEVVRAAEECAVTLANSIPAEQCIRILNPIINTAEYPVNLAAIKMETKVVEVISKEVSEKLLPEIIPGLLKGYDDSESSVRKASVFCLVAMYLLIGEDLRPHLTELNGSKMKLLNLYIKRAQAQADPSSGGSRS